ncbi:PPOX class F420-dependent oxidoreductase [Planotetraspora mira]|jgi:PPOX class probable F420-dependent enzyme|uniref:PPOX class F420-dependent oxidoreductase n=1 Tax=Planotetraspora mira TaxID=58121 RepID=A0A8J3TMJ4_9ACTN|nr:PPOX class F420-dependent oxidoreductase [Planotetraspora mira]GII28839.1 PPOX class F420-dependent oxidoreductase [Planotetraspora mira]
MTIVERLGAEKYVSVVTFRRNGTPVATPIWVVPDGDALAIWTGTRTGKVKRVRNNPEVTVTPCDVRGNVHGEPADGRAEVMSAEDTERVRALIIKKYGLVGWLTVRGSRLRRGREGTVGIRISMTAG